MEDVIVTPKVDTPVETQVASNEVTSLKGFFNASDEDVTKLSKIVEYYKADAKELTDAELLWKVKDLELKLGAPALGERRIEKVYRYISLQSQIKNLEKEQQEMLRR